jgi:hypothetical protein
MRKPNLLGAALAALYGAMALGILTVNSSGAEARADAGATFKTLLALGCIV